MKLNRKDYNASIPELAKAIDKLKESSGQGQQGPPGIDGASAYEVAVRNGFVGDEEAWLVSLKGATGAIGPQGPTGETGATGLSAYEIAKQNGYSGTEAQWLASLKGAKGDQGERGIQGEKGDTGATGPQGEQGVQGIQGPAGPQGPSGKVGTFEYDATTGNLYYIEPEE